MNKIQWKVLEEKIRTDSSLQLLIATNLMVIGIALVQQWNALEVIFVYWGQSVVLGAVNILRILTLKTAEEESEKSRIAIAAFFTVHYGLSHFVYLKFILFFAKIMKTNLNLEPVFYAIILFLINHLYSFIKNKKEDEKARGDFGKIIYYPYKRVSPMHLTLMLFIFVQFLFSNSGVLLVFMLLKTLADAKAHLSEHN